MDESKSEKPYTKYEGEVLYSGAPSEPESTDPLSIDKGHQDRGSLEPTESKLEKRKIGLKTKVGVGIAAAALLLGGGSVAAKKAMNQGHSTTTGPVPTNPSPSAKASIETTPSATATPEINPDAYASQMEQYAGMDVTTFESLPRDKRLAYAQYLIDYTVFYRVYESEYSAKYHSVNSAYEIKPTAASLDDTGQMILDNRLYTEQVSFIQPVIGASAPTLDHTKAREVLSAIYYNVGDNNDVTASYLQNIEAEGNLSQPAAEHYRDIVTNTSGILTGKDSQTGEKVQYKIVSFTRNVDGTDESATSRLVYHEFKSYDGSTKSVWLLDAQAKSPQELKTMGSIK